MEPDATPDLVGRTSARLLADGVGRLDRLEALRLLAVLDASTDANGRVRRPLDDLAAEFELPTMGVMRSLDHLERVGAIQREGGTVLLLDRDEGLGGMHLADFLDDVRASFDDPVEEQALTRSPWLARAGAALVAVAAAVGIIALAPSQPSVQPVATAPTSSMAGPSSSTSSTSTGGSSAVTPSSALDRTPFEPGAPTGSVPGADTTVVAAAQCPTGSPTAEIIGNLVRLSNPTSADVVVLSLDIGGLVSPTTLSVPAGQSVDYALPAPPPSASIDEWDWSDPTTARTCAS
jgi:hypothetical protein